MIVATFLNGATAMACLAIATFFGRFWRDSDDRLFFCLMCAFAIFAVNYSILAVVPLADERRTIAFLLRLAGFVAILAGLVLKNRELTRHVTSRRSSLQ
jgi:hypothetical protein